MSGEAKAEGGGESRDPRASKRHRVKPGPEKKKRGVLYFIQEQSEKQRSRELQGKTV